MNGLTRQVMRCWLLGATLLLTTAILRCEPAMVPSLQEYREYPCSSDPALKLFARFSCAGANGVLLVKMHGWHGQVKTKHPDNIANPIREGYFIVEPEMRGRGDSTGNPDCNGWELQDVIDAVEFARSDYRDRIVSPGVVLLWGGSGGGGNVYGLVGKFPDYFSAAVMESGISDYALWYWSDHKGEFREEMEGIGGKDPKGRPAWIGGSPKTNREAYLSRGGLTTVGNLLTPSFLFHGGADLRVPPIQARAWAGAALGQGRGGLVTYHELTGVGDGHQHYANETKENRKLRIEAEKSFFENHRESPNLPPSGSMVVAGYLKTSRFEVILDSIDRVARLDYDLDAGSFEIYAATAKRATLRVRDRTNHAWQETEVACHPLSER